MNTHRNVTASAGALVTALVLAAGIGLGIGGMPRTAHAEVAAADPIDAAMRTCLARSDKSSTTGQIECMDTARAGWQAAVESAWTTLQTKLTLAQKKRWQDTQTRWNASRDADRALFDAVLATTQGTSSRLAVADLQLQPVRDRALALRTAVDQAGKSGLPSPRARSCAQDSRCSHAMGDIRLYYGRLWSKMPAKSRGVVLDAQKKWVAFLDASVPVTDERSLRDVIGLRVALLKRLSDTARNS